MVCTEVIAALLACSCMLITSCGGENSGDSASGEAGESLEGTSQRPLSESFEGMEIPPKEYPSTPTAVVKQFFLEAKHGDLAGAVRRYVKNGDEVISVAKDDETYKWLEERMPEAGLNLGEEQKVRNELMSIQASWWAGGFTGMRTLEVYLIDGQWKIAGDFLAESTGIAGVLDSIHRNPAPESPVEIPPKEYPASPSAVVKQFFMEAKHSDLAEAVRRYIRNGDEVLGDAKDRYVYNWLKERMPEASLKVGEEQAERDDKAQVKITLNFSDGSASGQALDVHLINGQWKIDEGFLFQF